MSERNGLQMNYYELSGKGISNDQEGNPGLVSTVGSILCIDPAIDLSIANQYSNMSSGQYNMQFEIELENQSQIVDDKSTPIYLLCEFGYFHYAEW
jgi:hypothetical protein